MSATADPPELAEEPVAFLRGELQRLDGGKAPATVQTHISVIILGATVAWKVKKAVKLPYLDALRVEYRRELCERELALNRRTAPAIYRAVRNVVRRADGSLGIDADGELVEPFLEMRRFDEACLLDRVASRGELNPTIVARLAHVIAGFHGSAAPEYDLPRSGAVRVGEILAINRLALASGRRLLGEAPTEELVRATRAEWQRLGPLLDARQRAGQVRLCHGDLHLRNIVLIDGVPTLFDCLEFDAGMATTDVLYDLAFVLMDLWHRDLHDHANLLLNRYLDESDPAGKQSRGLALLGLFLSMRAAVRAHVQATRALENAVAPPEDAGEDETAVADEARAYLDLARRLLQPRPARLVAIGGLSGSGKSTAAAAVAATLGRAPGARVLSSDRIRKSLFGAAPQTRLGADAYRTEVSEQVYVQLRERAAAALAAGQSVIVDAVFDRQAERDGIEAVAAASAVPFQGIWLDVPAAVLRDRVARRRDDPSDADVEVVRRQLERDLGRLDWMRLADGGRDAGIRLRRLLESSGPG